MDVLQLMKRDHQFLRAAMAELKELDAVKAIRDQCGRLSRLWQTLEGVDQGLLFPELMTAQPKARIAVDFCAAQSLVFSKVLDKLRLTKSKTIDSFKALIGELDSAFGSYIEAREGYLMPTLRRALLTPEREELAMVYQDFWEHGSEILDKAEPKRA